MVGLALAAGIIVGYAICWLHTHRGLAREAEKLIVRVQIVTDELINEELRNYKERMHKMSEALERAYLNGKNDA